ncbi:MAG TPA: hypothetical protein VD971_07140 [Phycisphaerales bacterium]|nr:hypothetical protein [Phycisphaerales bacterium]
MRPWVRFLIAAVVGLVLLFGCLAGVAFRLRSTMTVQLGNGVELRNMEGYTDYIARNGTVLMPHDGGTSDRPNYVRIRIAAI